MEELETLDTLESTECPECPGPPPEFRLPPPPRPPFLTDGTFCSEEPLAEIEDCVAIPMIDASYHTNPSLQSTALIITCAVVLLLMAAIVSVVFWKHKRKVQNLLPCKSTAGSAAAAAAASGRSRVLAEGQPHPGPGGAASAVLYEDLSEAMAHSQLHNHLPSHHPSQAPTIEVRNPDQQQSPMERQPQRPRVPAPHHLDYLDYRDPRAILRVQDKPSRAVLGGYRTPRALLAKSQGVPLSIATHTPTPRTTGVAAPLLQNGTSLLQNSHLLLANQNAMITSQPPVTPASPLSPPSPPLPPSPSSIPRIPPPPPANLEVTLVNERYLPDEQTQSCPVDSRTPITPTHLPRLHKSAGRSHGYANASSTHAVAPVLSPVFREEAPNSRRPSVDSEGYSYIDFKDRDLEAGRNEIGNLTETSTRRTSTARLLSSSSSHCQRSNSVDSDGYAYIVEPSSRKAPGTARRIAGDGTEEGVCPLCTMQRIHLLLSKPEDVYLNVEGT